MNENLNLVEILKDCPQGTKLYSTVHGEVKFYGIREDTIICKAKILEKTLMPLWLNCEFRKDGTIKVYPGTECVLFPSKDQRDWSKFKAEQIEPELIDGEIYYAKINSVEWIFIYRKNYTYKTMHYVAVLNNYLMVFNNICTIHNKDIKLIRKATEEEKQLLLNTIKRDGFKWNEEKKTLEKIDVPHTPEKFYIRIGDIPSEEKSKVYRGDAVVGYEDGVSVYDCIETDGFYRIVMPFPLKEGQGMTYECLIQEITQCRYEIENPRNVYLVSGMEVGKGHDNEPLIKNVKILKDLTGHFNIKPDNTKESKTLEELTVSKFKVGNSKLVLDKFDINTLQPFDKVLVRNLNNDYWRPDIFSMWNPDNGICCFIGRRLYIQVIPYNDETKHLVGTTEIPPKKYITWEE